MKHTTVLCLVWTRYTHECSKSPSQDARLDLAQQEKKPDLAKYQRQSRLTSNPKTSYESYPEEGKRTGTPTVTIAPERTTLDEKNKVCKVSITHCRGLRYQIVKDTKSTTRRKTLARDATTKVMAEHTRTLTRRTRNHACS